MSDNNPAAAPGWYPDASGTPQYWDGSQWRTDATPSAESASGGRVRRVAVPVVAAVVAFGVGIGVGGAGESSGTADDEIAALTAERDDAVAELEAARADTEPEPAAEQPAAAEEPAVEPAVEEPEPEPEPDPEPEPAADLGSREAPYGIGESVSNDDWDVTLGEPREAWDEILAENEFNDPPADGKEFWIVPVTATYIGDETGLPWVDLTVEFVGSDGRTYPEGMDYCGVLPNDLTDVNELYSDTVAEGNVCVSVPAGADGLWTLSAGWSDPVFFSTS